MSQESDTVDQMQAIVKIYFDEVLELPCPDFRMNYYTKKEESK